MLNLLLAEVVQSDIVSGLLNVLSLIMMIADAALVAYAVYMFFMMVTAHDEGKRRNVKKHFFNTLSAIFIIVALIGTLSMIKVNITLVEKQSGGGGGAVTTEGTVKDVTLGISNSVPVGANDMYTLSGSCTIKYTDIQLKESGLVISRIENFVVAGKASGFPQGAFGFTAGQNMIVNFHNTVKKGSDGIFSLSAEDTFDNGNQGFVTYSVTVSAQKSDGTQVTAQVSGRLVVNAGVYSNIKFY